MLRLFLTPVVLIVFGIAVLAIVATLRRDRLIARTAWTLFAIAYVTTTAAPVGLLMRSWQVPQSAECRAPPAGILVIALTGGASGAARKSSDIDLLSQATYRRVLAAVDLASNSPGSRLMISGGAEVGTVNEAQIAAEFAVRLGWPRERLVIEDRSDDTMTSAVEVARLLRTEASRPDVVLVTSASHMRRASFSYRAQHIDVVSCSTDYAELPLMLPDSLVPTAGALLKASEGWKEVAGLIVYSLRSWAGSSGG